MKPMCPRCHVHLHESLTHCPVCGGFVQKVDDTKKETLYPTPDYRRMEKLQNKTFHSWIAFPLILAILLTLFIDLTLTVNQLGVTFLVAYIVFYLWVVIFKTIHNRQGFGEILLWQLFSLSIGLILIGYVNLRTLDAWPLQYVVPILIALTNLTFFAVVSVQQRTDVMLFQMFVAALFGLGQFSLVFWLFQAAITVPSLIAGLTSLLSLVALFTYLRKKFFDYIQRWLHI